MTLEEVQHGNDTDDESDMDEYEVGAISDILKIEVAWRESACMRKGEWNPSKYVTFVTDLGYPWLKMNCPRNQSLPF